MRPGLQAIQEEPREAALCKQMGKEMIMRKGLPSRARGSQVVSLFPYVCAVQRASWKMHTPPSQYFRRPRFAPTLCPSLSALPGLATGPRWKWEYPGEASGVVLAYARGESGPWQLIPVFACGYGLAPEQPQAPAASFLRREESEPTSSERFLGA